MTFCMSWEGFNSAIMAPRRPVAALWASRPPIVRPTIAELSCSRPMPNSAAMGVTCPITAANSWPRTRPSWIVVKNFAATDSAWSLDRP